MYPILTRLWGNINLAIASQCATLDESAQDERIFAWLPVQRGCVMWRVVMLLLCWPVWAVASIAWVADYEQARERAQAQDLPLMVYFDAPWCSWCHRYRDETLSQPQVSDYLQRHYISVQVDWDARPDLVRRYGANGLPYTVVLAPDGSLRSRFLGLVEADALLARLADERRGSDDAELRLGDFPPLRPQGTDRAAWEGFYGEYLAHLERLWWPPGDGLHGLFDTGLSLKWPQPLTWLWLEGNALWPQRSALSRATELERLWDRHDGGFFNYAEPRAEHLETSKLLPENAWMAAWFAGSTERNEQQAAASTLALLRGLKSERGGLYQARQAAQGYYRLPLAQRDTPPPVDDIVRADANGSAVWALACAAERGLDGAQELAEETLVGVLDNLWRDGRLHHARRGAQLGQQVWPEDGLYLMAAALALDSLAGGAQWRERIAPISDEIAQWAVGVQDGALHSDRAAILAWVAVQAEYREHFAAGTVQHALRHLTLGAETLPDRLVPGLAAWQRLLGEKEQGSACLNG